MSRKLIVFAAAVILSLMLLCTGASALEVEQVQVCMPAVDVYVYSGGEDLSGVRAEDVKAALGGEKLTVKSFSRSEQGIFYVYLLDVSGSIPDAHFGAAKAAVLNAYSRLRSQDKLALVAFGNDVTTLLSGGESRERAAAVLDSLKNDDNSTKFYNAMDVLVGMLSETDEMRRIGVVISDGIDDTDAGMSQQELESRLVKSGVSVNAMCIDSSPAETVESFRSFLRVSGGELYTFGPDSADKVLGGLLDRLDGGWRLSLAAANNIADGKEKTLSVDFGGKASLNTSVTPERWTPDTKRPRVTGVKYDRTSGTFSVAYSEPVNGAGDAASYSLTDAAGGNIAFTAAAGSDGQSATITPAAGALSAASGDVTMTVSGVTDISMEKNEVYKYSAAVYSGSKTAPAQQGSSSAGTAAPASASSAQADADAPLLSRELIIGIAAAVLLLAGGGTALALALKKSGKNKKPHEEPKEKKEKEKREKATATFMFDDKKR